MEAVEGGQIVDGTGVEEYDTGGSGHRGVV
jgi:hypothetical protein